MNILLWIGSAALAIILYTIAIIHVRKSDHKEEAEIYDPCETCVRWSECNGIDKDYCPLWQNGR